MSRSIRLAVFAVVMLAATRAEAQAPSVPALLPEGYWTGIVRWRVSHQAGVGQSTRHLSGSVAVGPSKLRAGKTQVSIKLVSADYIGAEFQWSVAAGRCFSGGKPLLPAADLPDLPINNDGVAEVDLDSPFKLEADALYHVNIYMYGAEETNVVACADLVHRKS